MTVLRTVAEALELPVNQLAAEPPVVGSVGRVDGPADELRRVLSSSLALAAVIRPAQRVDLPSLRGETDRVWDLAHAADCAEVVPLLAGLLPRLEAACRSRSGGHRGATLGLRVRAHHATAAVLAKPGQTESAWVAADRAISAAERAGDPLLMAAGVFRLALAFQADRRCDSVEQAARTAAEAIEPLLESGGASPLSVAGGLRLRLAIAAARANDAEQAYAELAIARGPAERLGDDRCDYDTESARPTCACTR